VAEHRSRMDELVDLAIGRLAEFHRTLSPQQKAKLVDKWKIPQNAPQPVDFRFGGLRQMTAGIGGKF